MSGATPPVTVDFPHFDRPPVEEVALGVYLAPIAGMSTAVLGSLWGRWRHRFARTQDQPALPPVQPVTFEGQAPPFSIQIGTSLPRVWFLAESDDHVVQVQSDRLIRNWRRTTPDAPYPHYSEILPEFRQDIEEFFQFLQDQGLAMPPITQCEVTYVNPIPADSPGLERDPARLVSPWTGQMSDRFLGRPENMQFQLSYRIPDPGPPVARLNISLGEAVRPTADGLRSVFLLQLSARGAPKQNDLASAFELLDVEHEWIVKGFASLTTPYMHTLWGRSD